LAGHVSYDNANPLQRAIRSFAASGPGSWLFVRTLHHIDRRCSGDRGRHTAANLLSGIPVVMLTTTGAKSGLPAPCRCWAADAQRPGGHKRPTSVRSAIRLVLQPARQPGW